jgi:hypothetical protein
LINVRSKLPRCGRRLRVVRVVWAIFSIASSI